MIDHTGLDMSDARHSRTFYERALADFWLHESGLRPHYHANYYGAFVLDPDGHNIEVVCHNPAP